jgi:putative oxidoreductase
MMDLARLLFRIVVGGLFVGHGTQKLFGWFGGGGQEGTGEMMESVGLRPGRAQALLAGSAEAGNGVLLATGTATPLAVAGISGVMLTAIRRVHWQNGPWNTNGGYEYPAVILAALAALVEAGPGRFSVDAARGKVRRGTGWALAALGAGALGSTLAIAIGRRARAEEPHETGRPEQPAEPELRTAA